MVLKELTQNRFWKEIQMTWITPRLVGMVMLVVTLSSGSGCLADGKKMLWSSSPPIKKEGKKQETLVLEGGEVVRGSQQGTTGNAELEEGMELFRQQKYSEAQGKFRRISKNKKSTPRAAETALYYEAECLRLREYLKSASEVYSLQLKEFPRGEHHKLALKRMFDISLFWLQESEQEMKNWNDYKEGKRSVFLPASFVQMDKRKPFLDMEGRALQLLEKVYLNDIDGPLGEKSLFYLESVNFYRRNYQEADHYFSQIVQFHPNGDFASRALEMTILCKQLCTGGSAYDGRKVAEARKLVHLAQEGYPELAHQKGEFLERQLFTINAQQADADFNTAEFYRRTGHPGSAYFYYEIVRRRYPGTKYAELASNRMEVIRQRGEMNKHHVGVLDRMWNWFQKSPGGSELEKGQEVGSPPIQGNGNTIELNAPGGNPAIQRPELAPSPRPSPPQGLLNDLRPGG